MAVKAIITDIEGTTSSIHFVHEVLFPFARAALPGFVNEHRDDPDVRPWLQQVADEVGSRIDDAEVVDTLLHWIDIDRKHTALKALQGMIWASGYAGGDFRAHMYPEVAARLRAWREAGLRLFVYSSGSIAAQKLFFGHSEAGNLLPLFEGCFDTTIGGKREAMSYQRILGEIGLAGEEVVFLSDVVAELDAARLRAWREAGLRLFVYSSGSIAAQKLFFGHSEAGNLLPLFEGCFDTTIGGKREATSYQRILGEIGLAGDEVVFLSDVVAELDAAREAGMHTVLLERGQANDERNDHPAVSDFDAITLPD